MTSLNGTEPQTIDIQFQTFALHVVAIASSRFIRVDKLAMTVHTDVILFTSSLAISTDVSRITFRALHRDLL